MSRVTDTVVLMALAGCFILGRVTAPEKIVTVESKTKAVVERIDQADHSKRSKRMIMRQDPDGSRTVTVEDIIQNDIQKSEIRASKETETRTVSVESRPRWLLQGFAGLGLGKVPSYGLGLSYRLLGPFNAGLAYIQKQPTIIMGAEF
jgi:hypothetical protein